MIVLVGLGPLFAQPQSDQVACVIRQKGVSIPCPAGWNQLKADGGETVIGNFAATPENLVGRMTLREPDYRNTALWMIERALVQH